MQITYDGLVLYTHHSMSTCPILPLLFAKDGLGFNDYSFFHIWIYTYVFFVTAMHKLLMTIVLCTGWGWEGA